MSFIWKTLKIGKGRFGEETLLCLGSHLDGESKDIQLTNIEGTYEATWGEQEDRGDIGEQA